MENKDKNPVGAILVIGLIVLAAYLIFGGKQDAPAPTDVPTGQESPLGEVPVEGETTTITVPLISGTESGDFGPFGCGQYIVFVEQEVPKTQAVLQATYRWLFDGKLTYGDNANIVPSQERLSFDRVNIINGVAKVYLAGEIMGAHCGDAAFAAQIEQAALQYPGVSGIEVYLNEKIYDWCMIDESGGEGYCPENPQTWDEQRIKEIQ